MEEFLSRLNPIFQNRKFQKELKFLYLENKNIHQQIKNSKMSKYIYILIFFLGFVIGCSKESDLVAPVDSAKGNEPNWIAIPSAEDQSLQKKVFTGKWICGDEGSTLKINTHYRSFTPFRFVKINASAEFQENSFEGCTFITMSVSDRYGVTTFLPDIYFSKPVIYNLTITGVDLRGIDSAAVKFVYMATDGEYYQAEYDHLNVDPSIGMLQVINVKLPHFSRYGFAN
jgi:hypothetical protein